MAAGGGQPPERGDRKWYNTEGEWELVTDEGFIFKRRKWEVCARPHMNAAEEQHPTATDKPVLNQAVERHKKKKMLLAAKALYAAELQAWDKLAAAAAAPPLPALPSASPSCSPTKAEDSSHEEMLDQLSIEVTAMEIYIRKLQDIRDQGEATHKFLVKDLKEEVHTGPAEKFIHALTDQMPAVPKMAPPLSSTPLPESSSG